MYAGNMSSPVTWYDGQVDVYPYTGDPKFINPYTSDFLTALSSNPDWDEVVRYLSRKFKVGYNSDTIKLGYRESDHAPIDFYSNSTVSISGYYPTLGYHDYTYDQLVDSDSDKMPDAWEVQYISTLNPESASDKWQDSDGDGATNIEEFAFRGNPTDDQDIGYSGAYNFEISNTNMIITQVIPLRSNWDDLGLIMDTYWKSNLNQTIWSPT